MRTLCIWHLQYLQSFRNCCLFCTYWLIRNLNCADSHHANYTKHSLNHHFLHCAHFLYEIYSVFKLFEMAGFFCTLWLIRNFYSGEAHHVNYSKQFKWSFPTLRTLCIWHLQYLQSFRNCCLFCTYWLIRNLNYADFHHASYGERCSNHHFRHCAQCVSEVYSVLKLFEIAVCFARFGIFEISTAVRRIMLTIANIV